MTDIKLGGTGPFGYGANFDYKGDFPLTVPPCHGTIIKISKKKFLSYHVDMDGKFRHEVISAE